MPAFCCRSCAGAFLDGGLDLGLQPVANRFKKTADADEPRHPLRLIQCSGCGLVQLAESFPPEELCPRFDWIKYREREDHLDEALLTFLPILREAGNLQMAAGISDYDLPLLHRIGKSLGISTWKMAPWDDLGIEQSIFGSETLQKALTPKRGRQIASRRGPSQLIVSRYLLEHAGQPREMLACLGELLSEDGWLLLEVPDAAQPLERCDYAMIWEEHVTYFTEETIRSLLHQTGFSVVSIFQASSKFERPMLVLARRGAVPDSQPSTGGEIDRFRNFASSFLVLQSRFEKFCSSKKSEGFTLALLGAGHFACAFANYFQLTTHFSFVADDDPNKALRFLPGTGLEILPTAKLNREIPMMALLCLNPDVEDKVMTALKDTVGKNTVCLSIFSASDRFCLEVRHA